MGGIKLNILVIEKHLKYNIRNKKKFFFFLLITLQHTTSCNVTINMLFRQLKPTGIYYKTRDVFPLKRNLKCLDGFDS